MTQSSALIFRDVSCVLTQSAMCLHISCEETRTAIRDYDHPFSRSNVYKSSTMSPYVTEKVLSTCRTSARAIQIAFVTTSVFRFCREILCAGKQGIQHLCANRAARPCHEFSTFLHKTVCMRCPARLLPVPSLRLRSHLRHEWEHTKQSKKIQHLTG